MCCHQHRYAQLTEKIKSSHRLQQKNGQMMQLCHISYSNANMALKHGHLILLNTRCLDSSLSSCLFLASSAHITGRRDRNAREGGEDENRGRRFERSLTFFFSRVLQSFSQAASTNIHQSEFRAAVSLQPESQNKGQRNSAKT